MDRICFQKLTDALHAAICLKDVKHATKMEHNAKNALKEFGIIQLNCEQAEEILHLRSYDTI